MTLIYRGQKYVQNKEAAKKQHNELTYSCLLYTSDAADELRSVDLGGRRIIKKKILLKNEQNVTCKKLHEEKHKFL